MIDYDIHECMVYGERNNDMNICEIMYMKYEPNIHSEYLMNYHAVCVYVSVQLDMMFICT